MTRILTDEANELLLDVREHLGAIIDHPGSEAAKEQELQTAFNKVQEIINLTDKPKGLLDVVGKRPSFEEGLEIALLKNGVSEDERKAKGNL